MQRRLTTKKKHLRTERGRTQVPTIFFSVSFPPYHEVLARVEMRLYSAFGIMGGGNNTNVVANIFYDSGESDTILVDTRRTKDCNTESGFSDWAERWVVEYFNNKNKDAKIRRF